MKKALFLNFLILFSGFLTSCFAQPSGVVVDEVIAVVGKHMIKLSELETNYLQVKMSRQGDPEEIRCELLESMLINKLMLHQADMDSVQVTKEQVEAEMDRRLGQMVMNYGSRENLERQFGKTMDEIKEQFAVIVRENMLISNIEGMISRDIKVTPQEVEAFYVKTPKDSLPQVGAEYELIQIVKRAQISEAEKEAVRTRLNEYRDRILKGAKFSTLASLYSEDPGSARKGGELGFFGKGDMVETFEIAAFGLKEGEISPVIETTYGFHIIQMIERKGNRINCRHILLQAHPSPITQQQTRKELDSIASAIRAGSITIDQAVMRYSEDSSKINGGYIINPYAGTARIGEGECEELLQSQEMFDIKTLKQGEISSAVLFRDENGQGLRLIYVKKKIAAHQLSLEDDYDKVHNIVLQNTKSAKMLQWASKLIAQTYIHFSKDYSSCNFKLSWNKR